MTLAAPPHDVRFDAIGTAWSIRTALPIDAALRERIDARIEAYDRTWASFRADSAVTALAEGGSADLGPEAAPLLGLLVDLASRTGGAVTPIGGRSLERLGYGADYRLSASGGYLPAPSVHVLHAHGAVVTLDAPALIDVGAAGKGQLIDIVADELAAAGHTDFLVDGGHDLRAGGEPVRVALEHPFDETLAIGVLELRDAALAASATNRRSWAAADGVLLHHVLDGRTGEPVREIAATWVLAADALTADALSTALFFVEPELLADAYEFRYVRMTSDGRATMSADLPGELFR